MNKKTIATDDTFLSIPPTPGISVEDVVNMALDAESVLSKVREKMLQPYPRKTPPELTAFQLAGLLGLNRTTLKAAEGSIKSVRGTIKPGQTQKSYTLEEASELYQLLGNYQAKPQDKKAKTIIVASYKGGVGKTTTAVSIAQGLAQRAYKTLLLDLDGQGSATMLMGISPEVEVEPEQTLMGFLYGDEPDLRYAVQKTYWHNLDIIPASSALLSAEFVIPANAKTIEGYDYWQQLSLGLAPLLDDYDCVVVDTPPSLGYLTQNAMVMADMIFAPCPEEALDYASLCQFWGVYAELAQRLPNFAQTKIYDCVEVFITKAQAENNELSSAIRQWIKASFGVNLCEISIPESSIPQKASAELKTVFELTGKDVSSSAYKRYKEPLDQLINHITSQIVMAWRR